MSIRTFLSFPHRNPGLLVPIFLALGCAEPVLTPNDDSEVEVDDNNTNGGDPQNEDCAAAEWDGALVYIRHVGGAQDYLYWHRYSDGVNLYLDPPDDYSRFVFQLAEDCTVQFVVAATGQVLTENAQHLLVGASDEDSANSRFFLTPSTVGGYNAQVVGTGRYVYGDYEDGNAVRTEVSPNLNASATRILFEAAE